jgi:hypothetical protein
MDVTKKRVRWLMAIFHSVQTSRANRNDGYNSTSVSRFLVGLLWARGHDLLLPSSGVKDRVTGLDEMHACELIISTIWGWVEWHGGEGIS